MATPTSGGIAAAAIVVASLAAAADALYLATCVRMHKSAFETCAIDFLDCSKDMPWFGAEGWPEFRKSPAKQAQWKKGAVRGGGASVIRGRACFLEAALGVRRR